MDIMEIFKTVKKFVNIDIFRKSVFINSQYCNWYNVGNNTILAGIMRNIGYFYKDKLSAEDIQSAGKIYRKYTTIMNCVVGVEILLYIYLVIFPFFLQFMKQQFIISVSIPSGSIASILYCPEKISKCDFINIQSVFLCMGRTEICVINALFYYGGLFHRKESGLV